MPGEFPLVETERRLMPRELKDLPPVLTVAEVKRVTRCGERQVREWIASGQLYSFRIGRAIRVPRRSVEELLAGPNGREASAE